MSGHTAAITAVLLACSVNLAAQDKQPKPDPNATLSGVSTVRTCDDKGETQPCIHVVKFPPMATTSSSVKNGEYVWELRDPNNEYRCLVTSALSGIHGAAAFTVTCFKKKDLEPNEVSDGK